jgi:hypothetical protein
MSEYRDGREPSDNARESAEKVITAMACALKPDLGRKLRAQWRAEAMRELERHEREFPRRSGVGDE